MCTLSTPPIISLSSGPGRDGALLRSGRAVRFAVNLPTFYDRQVAARCYSTASIMPVSKTGSRIYGIFELPEGVVVRHHRKEWIEELTGSFGQLEFELFEVTTMSSNKVAAFQYLCRAQPIS